ncbi:hypothetical protein TNCV_947981 [Trichonephila clavipes]|nr:hypothetical protein TNCV_947981 [Trichonephila clavipes]
MKKRRERKRLNFVLPLRPNEDECSSVEDVCPASNEHLFSSYHRHKRHLRGGCLGNRKPAVPLSIPTLPRPPPFVFEKVHGDEV